MEAPLSVRDVPWGVYKSRLGVVVYMEGRIKKGPLPHIGDIGVNTVLGSFFGRQPIPSIPLSPRTSRG